MEKLIAASTGAGGLGTLSARWMLIGTWALGVMSDALVGVLTGFGVRLLTVPFGLLAVVVVTTPGDEALTRPRALVTSTAAVIAAFGSIAFGVSPNEIWLFYFSSYLAALLIPRGNVTSGIVAGLTIIVSASVWGVSANYDPAQMFNLLALPSLALIVGLVWRTMLVAMVRQQVTHYRERERATMAAEVADHSSAATLAELAEIRTEVEATLSALRDGHPLDDDLIAEISVVEANLRDRIRSPYLRQNPTLRAAIDRARRRGVKVQVLGDPAHHSAESSGWVARVVQVIDDVAAGAVTLRAIPPGRDGVISLLRVDDEAQERLLLDGDGQVLSRH